MFGFEENDLQEVSNPKERRYWKNIIPENETSENLLINITSEKIDNNVIDDKSGTQNLGFSISDYKPNFNNETLKPLKRRTFNRMKTSKTNGAF